MRILITGGSGFIGKALSTRLAAAGCEVTVPCRRPARVRDLLVLPRIRLVEADLHDDGELAALLLGQDAVVNLVAVLHGRPGPWTARRVSGITIPPELADIGPVFGQVQVDLVSRLAALMRPGSRLVHVSALGAERAEDGSGPPPSRYLRAKAAAESVIQQSGLAWTIVRPSVVFGAGDHLLTVFASLQRFLPLLALPRAQARFQPIWVRDLAEGLAACLIDARGRSTVGLALDAVGPEVLTLADVVRLAGRAAGHPRPVLGLPDGLARLQAAVMEAMPGPKLMTRDNLDSMTLDNIARPANPSLLDWFDIVATPITAVAPLYLGRPADVRPRRAGH